MQQTFWWQYCAIGIQGMELTSSDGTDTCYPGAIDYFWRYFLFATANKSFYCWSVTSLIHKAKVKNIFQQIGLSPNQSKSLNNNNNNDDRSNEQFKMQFRL